MSVRHRLSVVAALAAAALATVTMAQPAVAATDSPDGYFVSLYTGTDLTGTKIPVPLDITGECVNLDQPAGSGVDIAPVNVEIYFNADCVKGYPGRPADLYFVLGSLHQATFPFAAVSYRVAPMS